MTIFQINIIKLRHLYKMSQDQAAIAFKVTRPTVGAWEEGRSTPRIDQAVRIARTFHTTVECLYLGVIKKNKMTDFEVKYITASHEIRCIIDRILELKS